MMKRSNPAKLLKACKEGEDEVEVLRCCAELMVDKPKFAVTKNVAGVAWRKVWYDKVKKRDREGMEQAVGFYEGLLKIVGETGLRRDLLLHLGDVRRERGEIADASKCYLASLDVSPSNGAVHHSLSLLHISMNEPITAGHHLTRSIAAVHPFPPARRTLQILSRKTHKSAPDSYAAHILHAISSIGKKPGKSAVSRLREYLQFNTPTEDEMLYSVSMGVHTVMVGKESVDAAGVLQVLVKKCVDAGYRRAIGLVKVWCVSGSGVESVREIVEEAWGCDEYVGLLEGLSRAAWEAGIASLQGDSSDVSSSCSSGEDTELLLACPGDFFSDAEIEECESHFPSTFTDLHCTPPQRDAPSPLSFASNDDQQTVSFQVPFSPAIPCRSQPPMFAMKNTEHHRRIGSMSGL